MSTKIAVLGGSAVSTPQLVESLAAEPSLAGRPLEVVLIGRTEAKLARVATASRRVAGSDVSVEIATAFADGVSGADYIVNQVRIGGLEARAFDERFPHELGQPGEETMGLGGFANAWRTLPAVAELFALCANVAPGARLLNLTNPAGMVHQVAVRAGLNVTTFCDSPIVLAFQAAEVAGADPDSSTANYIGTNHSGWLTSLQSSDEDFLARALIDRQFIERLGFDPEFVERLGVLPNVYLRYVYHPEHLRDLQLAKSTVRADELLVLERETLVAYEAGDPRELASKRKAVWYSACIAPALASFISGTAISMIAGVTNGDLVPSLPSETMLEVPVALSARGTRPTMACDPLPADVSALLAATAAYEALAVDALLGGDREDRVRALAANPMVSSVDLAAQAVERIAARESSAVPA